jgi:CRISPR-associated protein Cas4
MGKIDLYRKGQKLLIERKYQLKKIFKGQIYQLWAQYFCMKEMDYEVEHLSFYEISTNKMVPIELPGYNGYIELKSFIKEFRQFNPNDRISVNYNKCIHCIYCNICDKTNLNNVYT